MTLQRFFLIITQKSKLILMILYLYLYLRTLTSRDVIVNFKSAFNKDKNHCYYNIFLEKCSNNYDGI